MKEKEATINRSGDSTIKRSDGAMIVALWLVEDLASRMMGELRSRGGYSRWILEDGGVVASVLVVDRVASVLWCCGNSCIRSG